MDRKEIIVDNFLCLACLCVGRTLHNITDQRMRRYYLETLNEVPLCNVPKVCPSLCWECSAMLRKAVSFKEQVKDSFRILQTYTNENLNECLLSDIMRSPRYRTHRPEPVSIPPSSEEAEPERVQVKTLAEPADEVVTAKEEGSCWDAETQVLLSNVEENESQLAVDVQMVCVKEENCDWNDGQEELISHDRSPSLCDENIKDIEKEIEDVIAENLEEREKFPAKDSTSLEEMSNGATSKKKRRKQKNDVHVHVKLKKGIRAKRFKTGKKPSKQKTDKHKIRTIELSYEDMLLEREREATRDSYMKAAYKCESCLIGFNYTKSYAAHVTSKHSPDLGDYSCPICKTIISSIDSFTSHYKRHMRRYECVECGKRTADSKAMSQHYYSTHQIQLRQYTCDICGLVSKSIDTHRYHKDTHKPRIECSECEKTFSHRAGLLNHRVTVHELHNDFLCTECGKTFRWKTSLKRHLDKHTAKDDVDTPAAFCSHCDIGFSSESSYRRHLRNSLKHVTQHQLRFICDDCGRRFADKTKLRDHIEEKHLHKTYICNICSKPSKNRVGLDQHIRNVHKGRPNNKVCHYCGKAFPTKVQLESHIRTHTGERPFICEYCPTTFSQQSNLYKHNRQVHLNIKSKRYVGRKREAQSETQLHKPRVVYSPDRHFT